MVQTEGVYILMLQALVLTILCGMIVYFITSYIIILGLSQDNTKFFTLKCGIIVIGITLMFFIFRDMSNPLLPELQGISKYPHAEGLRFKHLVVIFVGGLMGYIGQILDIKE